MRPRNKKGQRHKDLTEEYLAGTLDEDRLHPTQRFNRRSKFHQINKTARTALMRIADSEQTGDIDALPVGRVLQVHSLFYEVEHEGVSRLCVLRRTLGKVMETQVVVGDRVRFRDVTIDEGAPAGEREGVIERVEPRRTLLTRASSFLAHEQDPIIANADQMLVVVSLLLPRIKWGLIDRMLVAARVGGLRPIVCLNKVDLAEPGADRRIKPTEAAAAVEEADVATAHLASLEIQVLRTSVTTGQGIDEFRAMLKDKMTALAGHSGVGKSSLVSAVQPGLDIRVGDVSNYNQKGRHTTTSARLYDLDFGGSIIDTPGIRSFGLWNLTPDALIDHFPDVAGGTAPEWRVQSYEKIKASLE
jgi:ribosome biogenesis GTPase